MRSHVIANPRAGRFASSPGALDRLRRGCAAHATVHVTGTLEELRRAVGRVREERAEVVALCGGDGTHMACVSALSQEYADQPLPAIVLATGGHANTVARNWCAKPEPPEVHVPRVLGALHGGARLTQRRRPTLRVTDSTGATRVGFIFGAGLVAAFFEEFYARGGGGYVEAGRMVARILGGSFVGGRLAKRVLTPVPMRLTIDGNAHPSGAFTMVASSVLRNLGMHLMVTHRAGEDPHRPHLVASTLDVRESGRQFWRILAGRGLLDPKGHDGLASRFALQGAGAYVLDGDLLRAQDVTVEAGPELKLVEAT